MRPPGRVATSQRLFGGRLGLVADAARRRKGQRRGRKPRRNEDGAAIAPVDAQALVDEDGVDVGGDRSVEAVLHAPVLGGDHLAFRGRLRVMMGQRPAGGALQELLGEQHGLLAQILPRGTALEESALPGPEIVFAPAAVVRLDAAARDVVGPAAGNASRGGRNGVAEGCHDAPDRAPNVAEGRLGLRLDREGRDDAAIKGKSLVETNTERMISGELRCTREGFAGI